MPFELTPEILGYEQAEEIDAVAIEVQAGNGNRHKVDHPKWSTDFTNIVFDQKIKDLEFGGDSGIRTPDPRIMIPLL